ncbi:MAG: hypothetical protein Q8M65_09515 [Rhodoglobus sp.]|nr:hypothetical protein [Rhodoglobus sp.]
MAAPLGKGQLAQLDEDNGFAIVARTVATHHPMFMRVPGRNERVNWDNTTIASKSTVLTTLQTLKEMADVYLTHEYSWGPTAKGMVPERPDADVIVKGTNKFIELLTELAKLPSIASLDEDKTTGELRRFSHEPPSAGAGHMLFRPVGQIVIAQALGELVLAKHKPLAPIIKALQKYDDEHGFAMEPVSSLWHTVLYDPARRRVVIGGRDLAARLLVYLLGGVQESKELDALRDEVARLRTNSSGSAVNFDGELVPPGEIKLPDPLL